MFSGGLELGVEFGDDGGGGLDLLFQVRVAGPEGRDRLTELVVVLLGLVETRDSWRPAGDMLVPFPRGSWWPFMVARLRPASAAVGLGERRRCAGVPARSNTVKLVTRVERIWRHAACRVGEAGGDRRFSDLVSVGVLSRVFPARLVDESDHRVRADKAAPRNLHRREVMACPARSGWRWSRRDRMRM